MSETPVTEPVVESPAQDADSAVDQPKPQAPETDWRAESRKWEARAKENSKAAARLAEIEEASKTEAQKLADRLAAAEAKAAEAELRALRSDVAQAKGVPAGLLTGSNEAELAASADALLAFRGEAAKLPPTPSSHGQGRVGDPVGATDWDTAIADAQKRGDVAASIYFKNKRAEEARKP